jgi:hypothetical protein
MEPDLSRHKRLVPPIVDRRETAVPEIQAVFRAYPHTGNVLPAVGYSPAQLQALAATVNTSSAEMVASATPIDLAQLVRITNEIVRARYESVEIGIPALSSFVDAFLERLSRARRAAALRDQNSWLAYRGWHPSREIDSGHRRANQRRFMLTASLRGRAAR